MHITHALIDKSIDEVEDNAFYDCEHLIHVETHDGIRRIGKQAFRLCKSLRRIDLKSVVEIDFSAFRICKNLESVELGDRLVTIGNFVFYGCSSLTHLKLPSITTIGRCSFGQCKRLMDIEFSRRLEKMGTNAFWGCGRLQRIAIPMKRDLFAFDDVEQTYNQFEGCERLVTVDLVGGIYKTVASLHMDRWRTEMTAEISRINQVLPNTPADGKTGEIRRWMESVAVKMDHYKAEHYRYVKEGISLLELALWKTKLGEKEDSSEARETKKAKIDSESVRKERRITCGAELVIKNVLPFLELK